MSDDPAPRRYRLLALGLGFLVLGWQGVNFGLGRFSHEYLVADLAASALLIASGCLRDPGDSAIGMLAGFAMFGGIFLSATTGKLVVGGAHPGTIAAGLGLIPSLVGAIGLGFRLRRESLSDWPSRRGPRRADPDRRSRPSG